MRANVTRQFFRPVIFASVALAGALPVGCTAFAGGSGPRVAPSRPQLEIRNSGPAVRITPWKGAKAVFVACGGDRGISTRRAPSPPWRLTVRRARTRHLLARRTIRARSGYVIVSIDRRGMRVTRTGTPSSGPPPGCQHG